MIDWITKWSRRLSMKRNGKQSSELDLKSNGSSTLNSNHEQNANRSRKLKSYHEQDADRKLKSYHEQKANRSSELKSYCKQTADDKQHSNGSNKLNRHGRLNQIRELTEEMQQFQYLTRAEIDTAQKDKLHQLLIHSTQHIPAYQPYAEELQAEMTSARFDPTTFLKKLPIQLECSSSTYGLTEAESDNLSEANTDSANGAAKDGGATTEEGASELAENPASAEVASTLAERSTLNSTAKFVQLNEASFWRGLSWHNIELGESSVVIWAHPEELTLLKNQKWAGKKVDNLQFLNTSIIPQSEMHIDIHTDMSSESRTHLTTYIERLQRLKPKYLLGYSSVLTMLAEMMLSTGMKLDVPIDAIISTGETLHPHQRSLIRDAFGCQIVNDYQVSGFGSIGFECSHGQLHIPADQIHLEVVDPITKHPLPFGQRGLLLGTKLNPLFESSMEPSLEPHMKMRQSLGDIASLSDQPCTCGIKLPIFDRLEGREADIFLATSGSLVYGSYFVRLMQKINSFRGFQMIQHTPSTMTLKLVKHPISYVLHDEFKFVESIHTALGVDLQITVEHVEDIPRAASGKTHNTIRKFPLR